MSLALRERRLSVQALRERRLPEVPAWLASRWLWLAASLVALLYFLWPTFGIRFGVVDDHEIVTMVGPHDRLPASEVVSTIRERVNEPVGRVRPLYWVGRALEAATAGDNATWWYVDRFVLAAITLVAIYLTVVRYLNPLLSAMISLLPFCGAEIETWIRLGPNEAYAVPLLAVGAALVVRGVERGHRPARQWPGYLLLVASGLTKENFIPVAVVVIAWSALHYGFRRWRAADWVVLTGFALVSLANVAAVVVKVHSRGSVYPQARNLSTAHDWLKAAFRNMDVYHQFTAGAVAAVLLCIVLSSRPPRRVLIGLAAVCAAIAASQAFFYASSPPSTRYYYPVVFLSVVAWALAAHQIERISKTAQRRLCVLVVVLALLGPLYQGATGVRAWAELNAEKSHAFQDYLTELETAIDSSEVDVIVLDPAIPAADIEPLLAVARYLHDRTDVPIVTRPVAGEMDPYNATLNDMLRRWSRHGFSALSRHRKPDPDRCLSIVFSAAVPTCTVQHGPPPV